MLLFVYGMRIHEKDLFDRKSSPINITDGVVSLSLSLYLSHILSSAHKYHYMFFSFKNDQVQETDNTNQEQVTHHAEFSYLTH